MTLDSHKLLNEDYIAYKECRQARFGGATFLRKACQPVLMRVSGHSQLD